MKDLLGGDYWVDIDKFAERDMGGLNPIPYQNDMEYYEKYGHARAAKKGDKYGYDYYGNVLNARAWAQYEMSFGKLGVNLGGEIGHASLWRHGLWKKGLFLDDSQGNSKKLNYLTYKLKANFSYKFSAAHSIEANIMYMQDSPEFQSAFVSPRTRNAVTPGLSAEKVFGVDGSYNFRLGELRARVSGYYTKFMNQNKVLSYYDDVEATFSNFAMSGIDKRHFGVEVAASIPLDAGFYLNGALSWGQYTYDSNPNYVQIQDNSGEIKNEGKVYWKNFRVESTPQKAMNIGLSYRGPKNIYASLDLNYYSNMYISMSPLYRTDAVLTPGMTKEDFNVRIDEDNNLVISMEKKSESKEEQKEHRYLRREFSYSKFQQTMILPDDVDKEKIAAGVEHGVLTIDLPKLSLEEIKKAERTIEIK